MNVAGRAERSEAMDEEARSQKKIFASPDLLEAVTALIEGRAPRYD